jgi:predicted enzyme related to lactoylglutathione lyase
MSFQITGLTIAVTRMEAMLAFYSSVFGIKFQAKEMYGSTLYSGRWGQLELLFCPAEIAQNTATQNRHQFDIVVSDLDKTIQDAISNGGEMMSDIQIEGKTKSVGIYDPDRNSMTFKQI